MLVYDYMRKQVDLEENDLENFRTFAKLYFSLFNRAWRGMQRLVSVYIRIIHHCPVLHTQTKDRRKEKRTIFCRRNALQDPQDVGDGYRNVVGLPGGVKSAYFKILEEENVHHMELRESHGNDVDKINVVYVVDSLKLPFNQAEVISSSFLEGVLTPCWLCFFYSFRVSKQNKRIRRCITNFTWGWDYKVGILPATCP